MTGKFRDAYEDDDTPQPAPSLGDKVFGSAPAAAPRRNAIVPQAGGRMVYKRFTMTPVGLEIPQDVTAAELNDIGQIIGGLQSSMQWVIGDLMNSIGRMYGDGSYEKYAALFNVEPKTLTDWAYVCRNIELSIRIDNLSFGHHQLVASFEPQAQSEWLKFAAQQGLSIAAMRKAIKAASEASPSPPAGNNPIDRFTHDFQKYRKGLKALGQGERAELRQLAYDLILQIDQMEGR